MKISTLRYAAAVLAEQKKHADRLGTDAQQAYFDGMLEMANILYSEAFTADNAFVVDENGNIGFTMSDETKAAPLCLN